MHHDAPLQCEPSEPSAIVPAPGQCEVVAPPAPDASTPFPVATPDRAASALARSVDDALAAYSASIARTVAAMREQSGGILKVLAVDQPMLDRLLAARGEADPVLALVLSLVASVLGGRREGRPDALVRCACCTAPLRDGQFQLAAVYPDHPLPEAGLAIPVCSGCAVTPKEVEAVGWTVLTPIFGPIRVFPPMPAVVGHA